MMAISSIKIYVANFLKNSTVRNVLIVGCITFAVKAVGMIKEIQVGKAFGLTELVDTFLIASLIPGFINSVFMSSFQNVFIPNYIAEKRAKNDTSSFLSACAIATLYLGISLSLLAYLFTSYLLEHIFIGHSQEYYSLIRVQFYLLVPCIFFWSFSSLLGGVLEVKGLFAFSAVYPVLTSVIFLLNFFFFKEQLGPMILAFSLLLGSFFELLYLLLVSLYKKNLKFSKPDFFSENIKIVYRQMPSKIGSGLLTGTTSFVNQFFASQLAVGSIAAFNFGMKMPAFFGSLLILAFGNVLLPYFSRLVHDDLYRAYKMLWKCVLYVFLFALMIACGLMFFSDQITQAIFERGNFTFTDSRVVSGIQKILLLYIPFYVCSIIIIKFLTSINKNKYMLYASLLNLILNVILNYSFYKTHGVTGLALATTLVYMVNFIILSACVFRQRKIDCPQ